MPTPPPPLSVPGPACLPAACHACAYADETCELPTSVVGRPSVCRGRVRVVPVVSVVPACLFAGVGSEADCLPTSVVASLPSCVAFPACRCAWLVGVKRDCRAVHFRCRLAPVGVVRPCPSCCVRVVACLRSRVRWVSGSEAARACSAVAVSVVAREFAFFRAHEFGEWIGFPIGRCLACALLRRGAACVRGLRFVPTRHA